MDRLITLEPSNLVVIRIEPSHRCSGDLTLRNVMYTMPVAFMLEPLNNARYTAKPPSGIIPPLASLTVEITYHLSQGSVLPESYPHSDDSFLLHSVVAPGVSAAVPSDWFTMRKKQVFVDSGIKVMFVGSAVAARLVEDGSMDEVREVLERSDPEWKAVNAVDREGRTLLHLAISRRRPDIVQLLLEFGPDLEAYGGSGSTPLETAVSSGDELVVEILLSRGAGTGRVDEAGLGSIHLATIGSHLPILRLLIEKGADVDALTKDSTTALHFAASFGDENMVKVLLNNGANKDIRNRYGKTPYDVAAENGHTRLFDALRLGDDLCVAARKWEVRAIERVLENGAALNGRDQHGWTALHRVTFKGHIDAARALLDKGIEVDARDGEGYTALHYGVESGHGDIVEILLKRGADVEARTNRDVTAVQIAESLGYVGITRILVQNGASREGIGHSRKKDPVSIGNHRVGSTQEAKTKHARRKSSVRGSSDRSLPLFVP